jgi:hypothetical protein
MAKRTLKAFTDPGHGWLAVPYSDLETLGIVDKISAFSYYRVDKHNNIKVYLEEDCDWSTYMLAAGAAGWTITIHYNHTDKQSKIRSYLSYNHFPTKWYKLGLTA